MKEVINYRDLFADNSYTTMRYAIHIVSLVLGLIIFPIILLFIEQLKNLTSNETGFERRKN